MRIKPLLIASAALAIALPALAQQAAQPAPQPRPSTPPLTQAPSNPATPTPQPGYLAAPSDESAVEEIANLQLAPPPPPVEYPSYARRDPWTVGALPPTQVGLDADPWGAASGGGGGGDRHPPPRAAAAAGRIPKLRPPRPVDRRRVAPDAGRARCRPVGRGERRVPVDADAADGHSDRFTLGAYRAARRA